jgi:hypothetical protein
VVNDGGFHRFEVVPGKIDLIFVKVRIFCALTRVEEVRSETGCRENGGSHHTPNPQRHSEPMVPGRTATMNDTITTSTSAAVTLSVSLPFDLHARTREAAAKAHLPMAALVRAALETYLAGGANSGRPVTLDGTEDAVKRIEMALDRVLVETIRLGDRVSGIGR